MMNEDSLNMAIRKFLKQVGVTSQREIEKAVRGGVERGALAGGETLGVTMTLEIGALGVRHTVAGEIALED